VTFLTVAAVAVVAAALAAAGILKALDRRAFLEVLGEFAVGPRSAAFASRMIPALELALACGLLVPAARRPAGIAAALLVSLFGLALARALRSGRRPTCNCFGPLSRGEIGWDTFVRNVALIAAAAFVAASSAAISDGLAVALAIPGALAVVALAVVRENRDLNARVQELKLDLARVALPSRGLPRNSPAPEFTLEALDGGLPVTLESSLAPGLPVLLIFSAGGCSACRTLLPRVAQWRAELDGRLTFVVAASGEPTVVSREAGHLCGLTIGLDPDDDVARSYQSDGSPQGVLIAAEGTLGSELARNAEEIELMVGLLREHLLGAVASATSRA
jgi:hypothetical protein